MEHQLYEHDLYLTKAYYYRFNKVLIEYDMKEAGLSITKALKLLPEKEIKKIEALDKASRTRRIGLIQRDNPTYKKELQEGFVYYRKRFFEENNLQFEEIHSIKKDAIFTTRYCDICNFDHYITFRPKHKYTSYIFLKRTGEIYYAPNDYAIKGMQNDNIKLHDGGMNDIIKNLCNKMETRGNIPAINYMRTIIDSYKSGELPLSCYRRFDKQSTFDKFDPELDQIISVDEVDISYNLFNVLIPLCKVAI